MRDLQALPFGSVDQRLCRCHFGTTALTQGLESLPYRPHGQTFPVVVVALGGHNGAL